MQTPTLLAIVACALPLLYIVIRLALRPSRLEHDAWPGSLEFTGRQRDLLERIARHLGESDPASFLESSLSFDAAVERCRDDLEGEEVDLLLKGIRSRRGWMRVERQVVDAAVFEVNREIELHDASPSSCVVRRGVIANVDSSKMVIRVFGDDLEIPWTTGEKIRARLQNPDDAEYSFETIVIDRRSYMLRLLIVALPSKVHRLQKRSYARIERRIRFRFLHIPAHLLDQPPDRESDDSTSKLHDGSTENLGVGGFLMVCELRLTIGDYISIPYFPPVGEEKTLGRVVVGLSPANGKYQYGVRLVGDSAAARESLAKMVHELQDTGMAAATT